MRFAIDLKLKNIIFHFGHKMKDLVTLPHLDKILKDKHFQKNLGNIDVLLPYLKI